MHIINNTYSSVTNLFKISFVSKAQVYGLMMTCVLMLLNGTALNAQNPGGVSNNLYLWLKANTEAYNDAGTTPATNLDEVQELHDQSPNSFDLNDAGATGPDYIENAINFNPALDFSPNQDLHHAAGILKGLTYNNVYVYGVSTTNNAGLNNTFFYEDASGSNYFKFWTPHSNGNAYQDLGNPAATVKGRVNGAWGGSVGIPYLWSSGYAHNSTTPNSAKERIIERDGNTVGSNNNTNNMIGTNAAFSLGSQNGSNWYDGYIGELVILNGTPTATEERQIQSYLAIKYGITFVGIDYLNSSGTPIWDDATYSAFHNDIAGIGRDNASGLHQKQSKSVSSDAIVTMSTEAIAASNNANGTDLTDGAYLLWGNDNDDNGTIELIGSELPVGYTQRLDREWVVEKTGTVSNVHIEFDITGIGMEGSTASNFTLLTDADGDFSAGAVATVATSFVADKVTFDDFTFTDGQYFTLVTNGGAGIKLLGTSDLEITHDDQTPRAEDGTSFGVVPAAAGSVERTFKVINTGGSVLTVTNIDIKSRGGNGNEYDAHYTVNDSTTLTVAAGDTGIFKVTFDPTAIVWAGRNDNSGNKMAYVQIVSNSLNGNHEYDIHGTGVGGNPFKCTNGDMILVHRNPSDFYRNDYSDPDLGVSTLRTDQGVFLDGVGINPVDSFMYGMRRDASRFQLWVVADDGIRQFRGIVAGLADVSNHAVDFATDGYLYMKEAGTNTTFHKVDVQAMTSTDITLSQSCNFNDMAYNPIDGKFYAESTAGVVGLISIVPATGVVTLIANGNIAATHGVYGNSLGNIYGQAVSGQVFEWDLTDGSEVAVTNDPAGYNLAANQYDGAGCGPYKLGLPVVIPTDAATVITCDSAFSGGNVTFEGHPVTARGVCWSTTTGPTIADSKSTDGSGSGAFTSWITGTAPGTMYYVRAYATNAAGTSYGPEVTYTTLTLTQAGSIGAAQTICYNTSPAGLTEVSAATGGDGSYTYTWQSSTDNATWTTITDSTRNVLNPGALTTSTYYRRRAVSSNCDTAATASILITVYADLTAGTISIAEDTVCSGYTPGTLNDAASPTGGTGSYTYQWEISTTGPASGYSDIGTNGTNATYVPPGPITQDTWYRRKETSGACGTVSSNAQKVEVDAPLDVGEIGW